MAFEGLFRRKPKVPAQPVPPAQAAELGDTPVEKAFFQHGEASNQAAEAEVARRTREAQEAKEGENQDRNAA